MEVSNAARRGAKKFEDEHEFGATIEHYGEAADLFSAKNSASTAAKSKQIQARLYAQLDESEYKKAAELCAESGMDAKSPPLLKLGAGPSSAHTGQE